MIIVVGSINKPLGIDAPVLSTELEAGVLRLCGRVANKQNGGSLREGEGKRSVPENKERRDQGGEGLPKKILEGREISLPR